MHPILIEGLSLRSAKPADHPRIIAVLKSWWGGRDLTWMLPRLFLNHFGDTSFIIEKEDGLTAFLIGFLSPSQSNEGYIHFIGVHPDYRGMGFGAYLYGRFFNICRQHRRHIVRACSSPVNKASVEFHKQMGFKIIRGDADMDGMPVTLDYNKPGDAKVLFEITI